MRKAAADAGRDPDSVTICVAAPAYVTDGTDAGLAHGRDQCRWFGGMVGNHVADIVDALRHRRGRAFPQALSDYIAGRKGYDYNSHGKAGNAHTDFVPDEVIDRFCLIGPVEHAGGPAAGAATGSGSTSSRCTCSTTPRPRRSPRTATRCCPR